MNRHPYLRAYVAGIAIPTALLPLGITGYTLLHLVYHFSVPPERFIVFPMAAVPNLWGLWNMVWVATKSRTHLPVAVHGSLLPLLLVPAGILLGRTLELFHIQLWYALPAIPVGMAAYYLAWKFLVGSLNREMGIA